MEAPWSSEAVSCNNTVQRLDPEIVDLKLHRRENLKSRIKDTVS